MLKTAYQLTDADAVALNLHHYEGRGEMPEGLTAEQYAENPYQSNQSRNYFAGRRSDVSLRYTHQDEQNNFELLTYYIDSFRTSNLETDMSSTTKRMDISPREYQVFAIEPRFSRAYQLGNSNSLDTGRSKYHSRSYRYPHQSPCKFKRYRYHKC